MQTETRASAEIESGIPIPSGRRGRYNFDDWKVGDSILCETLEHADSAQTAAKSWAARRGNEARFTRRKVENGYRLWREA